MAVLDEDLAQEPAATLLLAERPLELVLGNRPSRTRISPSWRQGKLGAVMS